MLPSPTADATRLTRLSRTSPHAKKPGALVSRRYGSRLSDQRPAPSLLEIVADEHITTHSPRKTGKYRIHSAHTNRGLRPDFDYRSGRGAEPVRMSAMGQKRTCAAIGHGFFGPIA